MMQKARSRSKRGVILTRDGWQKLQKTLQEWENIKNSATPYTIEILNEITRLDPATISKVLHRDIGVDKRTLERFFHAFDLELDTNDYIKLNTGINPETNNQLEKKYSQNQYFNIEIPDTSIFYGRREELNILNQWILNDGCRLIALIGIGGIGKTSLCAKITQTLNQDFERTIWFSLRNAPPSSEILINLLQILSNGEETELSKNLTQVINQLLRYLQTHRCLLVFDNVDTIFTSGSYAGNYLEGYEAYGELFQKLGETSHQSCILMTSREKPKEIAASEGKELPVRSLQISGLEISEVKELFQAKGIISPADSDLQKLIDIYSGNPLYLKVISTTIINLCDGNIADFLTQSPILIGDVRNLIIQQLNRLSEIEKSLIYCLAIERDGLTLKQLKEDLSLQHLHIYSNFKSSEQYTDNIHQLNCNLLEILESLHHRSLIEKIEDRMQHISKFCLQPVVMEYVTINLIDKISQEITSGNISLFQSHALLKATSPDYIQEIQKRLILAPIIENLEIRLGSKQQIETQLLMILDRFRDKSPAFTRYVAGNVINLLAYLSGNISNKDFSHLNIRQVNFQKIGLSNIDFSHSNFAQTTFSNTFGIIFSLAFSSNEEFLVAGSIDGEVYVWEWQENRQIFKNLAHTTIVESVAFSSNYQKIASSSRDRTIKVWDIETGECLFTFNSPNHYPVKNLVFSDDGLKLFGYSQQQLMIWDLETDNLHLSLKLASHICCLSLASHSQILAFGCENGIVYVWDIDSEQIIDEFLTNSGVIFAVKIIDDKNIIACSLQGKIVQIWNVNSRKKIESFQSQSYNISLIDISQSGQFLATGSGEKIIKIWNIHTGLYLQSLEGHISEINAISFGSQNKILATASVDRSIKIWDITTGKSLKILQGSVDFIHSLIYSHDGSKIIVGSKNTIKFWDVNTQKCISNFFEHQDWFSRLVVSPNEQLIGCANIGNHESIIRIWDIKNFQENHLKQNHKPDRTLQGHSDSIWAIAFSPDSTKLVSGSSDRTIKIWDTQTGQCLKTLYEHTRPILSVAFSPNNEIIASCGGHSVIKIWDITEGKSKFTIHEKASYIIQFSPDSLYLASGHTSGMVKIWDINKGQCIETLGKYGKPIISMAFSNDGKYLAYGCYDGTVNIWDTKNNQCLEVSPIEISPAWTVAFSPISHLLAVGRDREVFQLWNINAAKIVASFPGNKLYENINISKVMGLSDSTLLSLKKLGGYD